MASGPIHVVDDDRAVCTSIVRLLRACGFDAIGHTSARDFLALAQTAAGGCVILDYAMPHVTGPEVQRTLSASGGNWQVVFLSGEVDVPESVDVMKSGAVDLLIKPADRDRLVTAVKTAIERLRAVGEELAARDDVLAKVATLTPREREVMTHVIAGRLNKQIAGALGTSERTIKHHRSAIMRKMGVRSVADLVRLTERAAIAPV